MYSNFAILFCCLIFSVDLSVGISFKNFRLFQPHGEETNETGPVRRESTTPKAFKTETPENFIKRSDLDELANIKQRYIVKNHLDEFETHYALRFIPDWSKVNLIKSPADQDHEIRRQRWEYILTNAINSALIENLKSELKKAQIDEKEFCTEIAGVYHVLSDNAYILNKEASSDKKKKDSRVIEDPLKLKYVQVFMKVVSDSKGVWDQNEEMVQIPKSLYEELMKKGGNDDGKLTKQQHEKELQRVVDRMKDKHRQIIRKGKVNGKVNLRFDSKMSDVS